MPQENWLGVTESGWKWEQGRGLLWIICYSHSEAVCHWQNLQQCLAGSVLIPKWDWWLAMWSHTDHTLNHAVSEEEAGKLVCGCWGRCVWLGKVSTDMVGMATVSLAMPQHWHTLTQCDQEISHVTLSAHNLLCFYNASNTLLTILIHPLMMDVSSITDEWNLESFIFDIESLLFFSLLPKLKLKTPIFWWNRLASK